ncbi:chondroitin sulfate proteoglycan 5-like [Epinephelus moara]|uniref:chondroitin sulfate proteoglycan 5-like n=1 Tax=Epinephelus moara TaxID=300413 RepID=UPI00214F5A4E|nr:chondroitin sulfate proteoglycan 5-like [Epinephelus moara]
MRRNETSFYTGCLRRTLLSCVLVLHLIPLSVHGNIVGTNATEPGNTTNVTSLISREDGPVKVSEVVIKFTGTSSSASPDTVTPRAGRIPRAGEEDEQSSGMFEETMIPALEEVGAAAPPQLSPDSAETEHLLPSNPRGPDVMESEEEEDEEHVSHTDPPWIHAKDTAVFDLDHLFTTTTSCNVQDYIWHKGTRCESVVTEFQVMCLAVGASALVVLLLFMIVVCFAKKLHVLKTENKKLRKRSSKYRPSSEQHNDNFSLSTIAEGSHPNKTMSRYTWECKTKEESDCEDDPNSQNKLEDPVKAPPKEDDSLNIHNSLTPKHENHKVLGEENSSEVNSLQNNMM